MDIKFGSKIVLRISQTDIKCLENDLVSPQEWLRDALVGKINQCFKRMANEWIPKLRDRGISIPAKNSELIDLITSQDDYKNRVTREENKE